MNPHAVDVAGKVMTVRGPIDPDRLGQTLMHEHLFIDVHGHKAPDADAPVTEWALWNQKLTLDNLHHARERRQIKDNWILSDVPVAVEEAMEFRHWGGGTIVDVTSIGLRRDPVALLKVSNATGLNIVMGTGWYQEFYHPPDMNQRTVEDLTEEIVRDITVGVRHTGIRSGIIGEVGIHGNPIKPNEIKSIRASGRASRATGAGISFHGGGHGRERLDVVDILIEEGVDPSRVVFGHSDMIADDMPLMLELLDRGVYIQFDYLGRVGTALVLQKPEGARSDLYSMNSLGFTALIGIAIPKLIDAGYADRVLISHDLCTKEQLKRYGGTGYSFILEKFVPHLRESGTSEEHIQMLMVENPKRVLTLAQPAP